jgi:Matrixin
MEKFELMISYRSFFALGPMLFFLSCGRPDHYTFVMSSNALPLDVLSAQTAAAEWNMCNINEILVRIGEPASDDVSLARVSQAELDSTFDESGMLRDPGEFYLGWTHSDGDRPIYVIYSASSSSTREIIAHEMGHAQGLKHRPGGIMQAILYGNDAHVTQDDCNQL